MMIMMIGIIGFFLIVIISTFAARRKEATAWTLHSVGEMNIQLQSMVNYVQLQWGNKLSTANIEQPKVLYDYNGDGEPSLFELDNRHRKYLQLVAVLCFRI